MTQSKDTAQGVDAYFVCATPRTGSSLLLGLLDSTGIAGRPQAYFRPPDEALWAERWGIPRDPAGAFDYADYVRAAVAAGTTDNGVFGAKLMWATLDDLVGRLGTVHPDLAGKGPALLERAFGRTRFVFLRRDDILAQAVSWLRAEQTSTWYAGGNGEIDRTAQNGRAPSYDPARIGELIRMIDEHNAAWEEWFASSGIRPYRVRYEELEADVAGVTRRVLGSLGLDPAVGRTVAARHRRQADSLNAQWIDRYRKAIGP